MKPYLAVVYCKVEMMQRMMRWSIDDIFQRVTGDHIGVMDLMYENDELLMHATSP